MAYPCNPHVRHDPHMAKRIEQTSRWNLRPNVPVVATGPTYQAVEDNALKNSMQQQHDHEMQKQRLANEEVQNQTAGLKEEIRQLKERMLSDGSTDLKHLEDKVASLTAKIALIEKSFPTKSTQETLKNSTSQSTSSTTEHSSQSSQQVGQNLNPWEKPLQD